MKKIIYTILASIILIGGFTLFTHLAKADLNDGLKADYSFTSNSNDSVNNNNLTNYGSLSYSSEGANFTGSQFGYISDANQTGLDMTGDFTISFKVKLNSDPPDGEYTYYQFLNKSNESNDRRAIEIYYRYHSAGDSTGIGHSIRTVLSGDGYYNDIYNIPYTIPVGTETHILLRWTASSHTLKLYVNGNPEATESTTLGDNRNFTYIYNNNAPFVVGAYYDDNNGWKSHYLDGKMKDLKVWNRNLTDSEISQVFGASPTPSPTPTPTISPTPTPNSNEPANPSNDNYVIWVDNSTGDLKVKVTHDNITKTKTLVDFSL